MQKRTERGLILGYTRSWFANSAWSIESFAHDRLALALDEAGLIEPLPTPEDGAAYLKARKAWGMRIGRIFNGTQPFPLEWKHVWIASLPREYRDAIRRDLLAMMGALDIRLPQFHTDDRRATIANLASCTVEFGEFLAAATPAHNGRYDMNDNAEAAERMLQEGLEVIEAIATELKAVATGTGCVLPRERFRQALEMLEKSCKATRLESHAVETGHVH